MEQNVYQADEDDMIRLTDVEKDNYCLTDDEKMIHRSVVVGCTDSIDMVVDTDLVDTVAGID